MATTPARLGLAWRSTLHSASPLGMALVGLLVVAGPSIAVAAEPPVIRICEEPAAPSGTLDIAAALGASSEVNLATYADEDELSLGPAEPLPPVEDSEEINADEELRRERPQRPITEITADAALPPGLLPDQVRDDDRPTPPAALSGAMRLAGGWAEKCHLWSATKFRHGPLYFEEVNLERYGYQCHPLVQPFMSGAHFFATVPALPYLMVAQPPRECVYTLGHYRPGSCAPWQSHRPPCNCCGAAVETGVVVGLVFLIP